MILFKWCRIVVSFDVDQSVNHQTDVPNDVDDEDQIQVGKVLLYKL